MAQAVMDRQPDLAAACRRHIVSVLTSRASS
jgi:hypothetical protein